MTSQPTQGNRSSNELFDATSFLAGANAAFIESLYAQYLENPDAVDPSWRGYFADLGQRGLPPAQLGRGPEWKRDQPLPLEDGEIVGALTGLWPERKVEASVRDLRGAAQESIRPIQLVRAYRVIGHLESDLDPLQLSPRTPHPQLDPSFYGFHADEMDKPVFIDGVLGLESATPRRRLGILKRTYCGRIRYGCMPGSAPGQCDML